MGANEQRLLDRPSGWYLGVDPGKDGAVALVRRIGSELTLHRIVLSRDARPTDCAPWDRAAQTIMTLCDPCMRVEGVAVEAPAARAGQSGSLKGAMSAGAMAGICRWLFGAEVPIESPQADAWTGDLACWASDGDTKGAHIHRLLDVCPGARDHIRPPGSRVDHDGAADAALLALWAAGLRGPGPSSPESRLNPILVEVAGHGLAAKVDELSVDGAGETWELCVDTATGLSRIAAAGVRAAKYGRLEVHTLAAQMLRARVIGGRSEAVRREARAALVAWGLTP